MTWQTKKLGKLCKITTGSSNTVDAVDNGKYAFFDRSKILKKSNRFLFDSEALIIPGEGAEFFPRYYSGKFDLHQRAYALMDFNKEADIKFVEYYLIFNHKYFEEVAVGATAKSLRRRHFENLEIPLPPLPEQKRIVKILDEVFEKTAKAKENTEKNLQNSRELFESYLQSVFANPGKDWEKKKLGKIADVEYGFTDAAKNNGDFRFVRITDIDANGELGGNDKKYIASSKEAKKFILSDGDLLMARTGATFAKVLYFRELEKSVFASYLIRLKFREKIENKLYWYFSKSKLYWDQARRLSSGSAQPQFNGAALKEVLFTYPKSLAEQKAIVRKLDALSEQTKKLEKIYEQKLAGLEELKKSVLKKAFSGEL